MRRGEETSLDVKNIKTAISDNAQDFFLNNIFKTNLYELRCSAHKLSLLLDFSSETGERSEEREDIERLSKSTQCILLLSVLFGDYLSQFWLGLYTKLIFPLFSIVSIILTISDYTQTVTIQKVIKLRNVFTDLYFQLFQSWIIKTTVISFLVLIIDLFIF